MLEHIRTKKSEYERSHLTMYENRDRSTGWVGNFFFSGMRKNLSVSLISTSLSGYWKQNNLFLGLRRL